jgi:hypothetical protein
MTATDDDDRGSAADVDSGANRCDGRRSGGGTGEHGDKLGGDDGLC